MEFPVRGEPNHEATSMLPLLAAFGLIGLGLGTDQSIRNGVRDRFGGSSSREGSAPRTPEATWSNASGKDAFLLRATADRAEIRMASIARAERGVERFRQGDPIPFGRYVPLVALPGAPSATTALTVPVLVRPGGVYLLVRDPGTGPASFRWLVDRDGQVQRMTLFSPPAGGEPTWVEGSDVTFLPHDTGSRFGAMAQAPIVREHARPPRPSSSGSVTLRSAVDLVRRIRATDRPVLVYTFRPTCPACVKLGPAFEAAARQDGRAVFIKVDDADLVRTGDPLSATEDDLVMVTGVPTLRLYSEGRMVREAGDALIERWVEGEPGIVGRQVRRWAELA